MIRQSSLPFVGIDSGTPLNEKLCGNYLQTFAYVTLKDRLPVILTKVIDQIARDKDEITQKYGSGLDAEEDLKKIIGNISKLKNEVQTNKLLIPITSASDDTSKWNSYLDELQKVGPVSWFQSPWLYTENYLYRRLREIFENSKYLKDFDPFYKQKREAFEASLTQLRPVVNSFSTSTDKLSASFVNALKVSLWGNRCDLSLSNGAVESQDSVLTNVGYLDQFLLADDSIQAFQVLAKHPSKIVDIVHDNASYELFTDLCLADYLITFGLATVVRLHFKKFPWYVSDATTNDVSWFLDGLAEVGLEQIVVRWREHISSGRWKISDEEYWTLPFPYCEMNWRDPKLYASLAESSLIIFKGDLNYRKLIGDINWSFTEPFSTALQGFRPSNILALRTIKADLVCGLQMGKTEVLFQKEPLWMRSGEYGIIQLSAAGDS